MCYPIVFAGKIGNSDGVAAPFHFTPVGFDDGAVRGIVTVLDVHGAGKHHGQRPQLDGDTAFVLTFCDWLNTARARKTRSGLRHVHQYRPSGCGRQREIEVIFYLHISY